MTAPADAVRAYRREYYDRYDRHVRGQRPLRDAAPVVERIGQCLAVGMSHTVIAAAAGVSQATISRLLTCPHTRVREAVALRILAVTPARPVTAVGLTRRVRALTALGWSTAQIAAAAAVNVDTVKVYRRGERVEVHGTARRIAECYDAMSMTRPPSAGRYERASASRARAEAIRRGWAPPLAWDEDTIDDPAAVPQGAGYTPCLVIDSVRELEAMGLTREGIAQRLGVTRDAVAAAITRARRSAA